MSKKNKSGRLGTTIARTRTIVGHSAPDGVASESSGVPLDPTAYYYNPDSVDSGRQYPALPAGNRERVSNRPQLVVVAPEDIDNDYDRAFSRFDQVPVAVHSAYGAVSAAPAARGNSKSVAQLFGILRKRLWLIVATGFAFLSVALGAAALSGMKFEANSRLYLGDLEKASLGGAQELDLNGRGQGDLGSEEEIIKSERLITKAILASGTNASLTPVDWSSPRYLQWRLSGRDPQILNPALREVRGTGINTVNPSQKDRTFRVLFTDESRYEVHEDDTFLGAARLGEAATVGDLQLTLHKGADGAPRQGSEYKLNVQPLEKAIANVQAQLEVVTQKRSGGIEPSKVVTLKFPSASPFVAEAFLSELMNGYLAEKQAWKTADASAAEQFISDQLKSTRDKLDAIQKKLVEFRANNPVVVLDSEAEAMVGQIRTYEEQRVQSRLEVSGLRDINKALKGSSSVEGYMMGEAKDSVLIGMANSLAEAKRALSELESRFGPESPDVKAQKQQVDAQLRSIKSYVTSRLARAESNLGSLSSIIGQYEAKLKTVPAAEASLAELTREAEVHSAVHAQLLKRQQENAIQKASTVSKNRILDEAKAPVREVSPSLPIRVASFPFGLIVGIVLVFFRSLSRGIIESEEDAAQVCGARTILAKVPQQQGKTSDTDVAPFKFDCTYSFFEAFRELRSNLYVKLGRRSGIITITSPCRGDGKTSCTLAIAASLASAGHSVLVLDLVLRDQSHSKLLNQQQGPGLLGVLTAGVDWRTQRRAIPVPLGEFHSLDMGRVSAPPETLSSPAMHRFLEEANDEYDFVLMDTPSYPASTDALHLVALSDAVISVLRLDATPRKLAEEHLSRFASNRVHTLCVLNGVPDRWHVPQSEYPQLAARRA